MKKTLKVLLLAGIASFFVACGNNGLVELTDEGQDKELYALAVKAVQEKYPDYKLYSKESLKTMDYVKDNDKLYRAILANLERYNQNWGHEGNYYNAIVLFKDKTDIKTVAVECFKKNKNCSVDEREL